MLPAEVDTTTKVLFEQTFTAIDARQSEMPAGNRGGRHEPPTNPYGSKKPVRGL